MNGGSKVAVRHVFHWCQAPATRVFDGNLHDLWHLSELAPERMVLLQWGETEKTVSRLLQGDWPEKRNVVFVFDMPSGAEARKLLDKLRDMRSRVY